MIRRALFLATFLALGCGAEAPVPDKPTWADDVHPILQANCFHCHGATADPAKSKTKRWDIYDLEDPVYGTLGFTQEMLAPPFLGARRNVFIPLYVDLPTTELLHMPPLPATPLSARDIQVLKNWFAADPPKGRRNPNLKPTIVWIQKGKSFEVSDGDHDQVLGKLDCGGTEVVLARSGGHKLPTGATARCTGTLYDGFDEVTVNLR